MEQMWLNTTPYHFIADETVLFCKVWKAFWTLMVASIYSHWKQQNKNILWIQNPKNVHINIIWIRCSGEWDIDGCSSLIQYLALLAEEGPYVSADWWPIDILFFLPRSKIKLWSYIYKQIKLGIVVILLPILFSGANYRLLCFLGHAHYINT